MKNFKFKKVKQLLWIILIANFSVAIVKIVIGSIIKSSSLSADGFHSLTDGSSNIVGLIGIHFASKPVDEDHPYGHRKYETLAGLFIAGMLFVIGGKVIIEAIDRFANPVIPEITIVSLVALIATLGINIFVCVFEYRNGKKLDSQILISDSAHTKSDIFISFGVLITLLCIKAGLPVIIDPIVSLIVAGFIIHAGYEIFADNKDILLDRAVLDTEKIKEIVISFENVKDVHKIRSRKDNENLHIDMHIMTLPDLSVEESHKLVHDIEKAIETEVNKKIQLIVHIEPIADTCDDL